LAEVCGRCTRDPKKDSVNLQKRPRVINVPREGRQKATGYVVDENGQKTGGVL